MTPEQLKLVIEAVEQGNWRLFILLIATVVAWALATLIQLSIAKRIEAAVANKQHFSRLRYERELEVYRDVWGKLHEHFDQSVWRFAWQATDPDAEIRRKNLHKSGKEFFEMIAVNRPFIPQEVWKELKTFIDLCDSLVRHQESMQNLGVRADESYKRKLDEIHSATNAQYQKVEEAIRHRLDKFDGA